MDRQKNLLSRESRKCLQGSEICRFVEACESDLSKNLQIFARRVSAIPREPDLP
jgi:hypothetical protein